MAKKKETGKKTSYGVRKNVLRNRALSNMLHQMLVIQNSFGMVIELPDKKIFSHVHDHYTKLYKVTESQSTQPIQWNMQYVFETLIDIYRNGYIQFKEPTSRFDGKAFGVVTLTKTTAKKQQLLVGDGEKYGEEVRFQLNLPQITNVKVPDEYKNIMESFLYYVGKENCFDLCQMVSLILYGYPCVNVVTLPKDVNRNRGKHMTQYHLLLPWIFPHKTKIVSQDNKNKSEGVPAAINPDKYILGSSKKFKGPGFGFFQKKDPIVKEFEEMDLQQLCLEQDLTKPIDHPSNNPQAISNPEATLKMHNVTNKLNLHFQCLNDDLMEQLLRVSFLQALNMVGNMQHFDNPSIRKCIQSLQGDLNSNHVPNEVTSAPYQQSDRPWFINASLDAEPNKVGAKPSTDLYFSHTDYIRVLQSLDSQDVEGHLVPFALKNQFENHKLLKPHFLPRFVTITNKAVARTFLVAHYHDEENIKLGKLFKKDDFIKCLKSELLQKNIALEKQMKKPIPGYFMVPQHQQDYAVGKMASTKRSASNSLGSVSKKTKIKSPLKKPPNPEQP